jgi:hypothetical protein
MPAEVACPSLPALAGWNITHTSTVRFRTGADALTISSAISMTSTPKTRGEKELDRWRLMPEGIKSEGFHLFTLNVLNPKPQRRVPQMRRLPTGNLRNEIFIRLADSDFDWLRQAAEDKELPVSTLARRIIRQAAQQDREQKGQGNGPQQN